MMFDRFRLYRTGRTTLGDAANYCLTVLEYAAGGRKLAAQCYNVIMTILNTLGELAGEKGGEEAGEKGGEEARKARGASKPFTGAERQWLAETMKRLIWRAAEIAGNPSAPLPQITMADLPPLP